MSFYYQTTEKFFPLWYDVAYDKIIFSKYMNEKNPFGPIPSLYFSLVKDETCQHPACVFVNL